MINPNVKKSQEFVTIVSILNDIIPSFNNNMVNINNNFNISYNIQRINNININKAKLSKLNNNIINILDCFEYNDAVANEIDNFQKSIN